MFNVFFILFFFFVGSYEGCVVFVVGKVDSIFYFRIKYIRNGGLFVCYGDEFVSYYFGYFLLFLFFYRLANRNVDSCGMLFVFVSKGIYVFSYIDYRFF